MDAIQTYYNDYHFRSRLEARWAVFFDAARIKYEYEPEGFELANGKRYLPDFYLPQFDLYVEVKRDTPDGIAEVLDKCQSAIVWGGPIKQIIILSDVPEGRSPDGGLWHFPGISWSGTDIAWGWWFFHDHSDSLSDPALYVQQSAAKYPYPYWYLFSEGNKNRKYTIRAFTDVELRGSYHNYWGDGDIKFDIEVQEDLNHNFFMCLKKARQARFEHGETP